MRIKTFGAKHFTGQLPRIEEGFIALGNDIVSEDADLIYCNNFPYDEPLKEKGFKIFTLLDVPWHCWQQHDFDKCKEQLSQADKICAISRTVQKDIEKAFGLHSFVVYQPTMPISQTNEKKYDYKYLIVGRNSDPNKRNLLACDYLKKFDPTAKVAIVGSEYCGFGDYFGVIPIEDLNDFYNSAEYIFSLTKYGGIELSQIEGVMAGKFPIVCNDSDIAMEFNLEFATSPSAEGIHEKVLEIEQNQLIYRDIVKEKQKDFMTKFDKVRVADEILCLF